MISRLALFLRSPVLMGVVTLASLALAIYLGFFYERRAELQLAIVSNTDVFSVSEKLSKLEIAYAGENLSKSRKRLRLVTMRLSNRGNADIPKSSFDDNAPMGVRVSLGQIIEPPEVSGSSYFKENVKPRLLDASTVHFAPVILAAGDSFDVRLLLLVSESEAPTIAPLGKIAGIKEVEVVDVSFPPQTVPSTSLLDELFDSPWYLHPLRLLSYFMLFIVAAIALPAVSDYRARARQSDRTIKALQWMKSMSREPTKAERFLADTFKNAGRPGLLEIKEALDRLATEPSQPDYEFDIQMQEFVKKLGARNYSVAPSRRALARAGLVKLEENIVVPSESLGLVNRAIAELGADSSDAEKDA